MAISVLHYCYNTLLIVAFTSVISFAGCMTLMRRQEIGIPVIGLFLFFLLDTILVDLTEFHVGFSQWYNQMFVRSPSIKTVFYLGLAFFSMFSYSALKNKPVSPFHAIVVLLLGLWYIFVPMLKMGALEVFLYYTAYQVFLILACIYALWDIPRCGLFTKDHQKFLNLTMIVTIVFSVLIAIEDYYVIFHVDNYVVGNLRIYGRNHCEDLLRLSYTVMFYVLFLRFLRRGGISLPKDRASQDGSVNAPADDPQHLGFPSTVSSESTQAEYKKLKFAQQLYLTERELEVFTLVLQGMNNQEISDALTVSMGTVKAHIHNIYQKADVTRRYELIRLYEAYAPDLEA